jgi:hypothetical protein
MAALIDVRDHGCLTQGSIKRHRKTLTLLNEQLSKPTNQLNDSTITVVVSLAVMSDAMGDFEALKAHIAGLRQMIRLRGGMNAFRNNAQLYIKIGR